MTDAQSEIIVGKAGTKHITLAIIIFQCVAGSLTLVAWKTLI